MSQLKLFMFGPPHLERQGKPVELKLRKAVALLVYLAVTRGEFSRDALATLFWPESDQSSARANLRRTLYIISKSLGDEILSVSSETVALHSQAGVWTDVGMFREIFRAYSQLSEPNRETDSWGLAFLEQSITLYTSDFLSGFSLSDCPEFDDWHFFESENLRNCLSTILQQLVYAYESKSEYEPAIEYGRRWLLLDNLHEPAHRLLMKLYTKSGQRSAALRQYQECARLLDQELGVDPQHETIELYKNIRQHRDIQTGVESWERPDIKYVASGDVHIAYQVFGQGPVDILWVIGYITHLEHFWELPAITNFFRELSTFSRVILFDRRGVGLSDRVGYPPTMDDTMDDILAVMRATGSKLPVLFGWLEGGPNSMLFAATYPELVSGLILYGTCAKWTRSEDYPWAITREQYDRWLELILQKWGTPINIDVFAPSAAHDPAIQEWWAKFMRLASSPGGIKAVLEVMRDIDVRHILPAISTPTLIMHRREDQAIRIGAGRYLAGQISGSKYIELEGRDTWFFIGDFQTMLNEIKIFIDNLGSPFLPERVLATILLVEILEDTYQYREELYYVFLHQAVSRFRGSEVRWNQGRYTAIFDGPSRAIQCASAILNSAEELNIDLHAGLHSGECEFVAGKLAGSAVEIAQCILNTAEGGEILVSGTVKDLVVGSGLKFMDHGIVSIEGIRGEWGIYSVEKIPWSEGQMRLVGQVQFSPPGLQL